MSKNAQLNVSELKLDLKNYRTTPQKNEIDAINAMISIKPDKFFGLMESILEDGYLHTENVIILETAPKSYIVKEGNRRTACLKLIHQLFNLDDFNIPASILTSIKAVEAQWLIDNSQISCVIYDLSESAIADRVVSLTHAKGEKAGRDKWTSVATARHNRDINNKPEPVLDLLEKYLIEGKNLSVQQKERWAGDYNLTVLVEAISKTFLRFEVNSPAELTDKYPKIIYKDELEELLRDIGLEQIGFPKIRNTNEDFALAYGINPIVVVPPVAVPPSTPVPPVSPISTPAQPTTNGTSPIVPSSTPTTPQQPINTPASVTPTATPAPKAPKALALNDPKNVSKLLKSLTPRGNRPKVVTLKNEILKLKINDNPIAFCFILRSMFEISAKAYCTENSIPTSKNGRDKSLVDLLSDAHKHLTTNGTNLAMVKILHGAMLNITTPDKILSVTSMNHLVHNPTFSISPSDICTLFAVIFPLLEAMN
jgi:hypothetical protein